MPSPAQAALLSWSIPPAATFALALTAADLSARLAAVAPGGSSLRSAVARRQLSAGIAFPVGCAGFAFRHLLRISADRAHDAAHDADDDCAAAAADGRAAGSAGARAAGLCGARVRGTVPQLASGHAPRQRADSSGGRAGHHGRGDVRLAHAATVRTGARARARGTSSSTPASSSPRSSSGGR